MSPVEDDLGTALRALAEDTPAAPGLFDAVASARARHTRRTRTFAVLGAAAALAVAVGVVATVSGLTSGAPTVAAKDPTASASPTSSGASVGPRTATGPAVVAPSTGAGPAVRPPVGDDWFALCRYPQVPLAAYLPEVTAVVRCRVVYQRIAGEGEWQVRVVERATGEVTPLLDLLRREPAPPGTNCRSVLIRRPTIVVVAGGKAYGVRWPDGACPYSLGDAAAQQRAAGFVVVASQRIRQVRTQAELDSAAQAQAAGCPDLFKDMGTVVLGSGAAPSGAAARQRFWAAGTPIVACLMTVQPTSAVDDVPQGAFTKAVQLDPAEAAAVHTLLTRSTAAPTRCGAATHRFVVLQDRSAPGRGGVLVQLDGCMVVEASIPSGGEGLWQAPQVLLDELTRLLGT